MIKTLTLEEAIATAFGLDNVPTFTTSKPLLEARQWLDRQGVKYNYERGVRGKRGVYVFTRGAGSPQYTVLDDETELQRGIQSLATLSPKYKSKSEERRIEASRIENDDVESAPTITNSPQDQADSETTVVQPKARKRVSRRKK